MSRRFLSALFSLCLAWQLAAALALAAAPPREPMLRIETGMHTAMVKAISVDAAGRFLATASGEPRSVALRKGAGADRGKQTPITAKPRTVPDFQLALRKQAP